MLGEHPREKKEETSPVHLLSTNSDSMSTSAGRNPLVSGMAILFCSMNKVLAREGATMSEGHKIVQFTAVQLDHPS